MIEIPKIIPKEITDKYSIQNNTFIQVAKENPKDKIEVEVGDIKQTDFLPQVKISRWDEVNCSIRLKDLEIGTPIISTDKDKIIWSKGNLESHFYNLTEGEGGYEFEVILKEKPKTNKIEFTLQDKGVEYFYQPELTQGEKDKGCERPENVVGSYAVYASENKINYVGGKLYRTGKVGHIYRPRIIDSAGTEVWGDLHIENGILSVTIPQTFLDNAVYPVRHAAGLTFGYTTEGTAGQGLYGYNGSLFTGVAGTLTLISYYYSSGNTLAHHVAAIYKHSDLSLFAYSGTQHLAAGSHILVEFAMNNENVTTEDYILTGIGDRQGSQGSNYIQMYYDAGDENQGHWNATYPTVSADVLTPASTFPTVTHSTRKYSIYATYTAAPVGTTVNSDRSIELTGKIGIVSDRAIELSGKSITNSERNLELDGEESLSSDRSFELHGVSSLTNDKGLELTGRLSDSDDREFELEGQIAEVEIDDERDIDLTGQLEDDSERQIELIGQSSLTDEKGLELTGNIPESDERDIELNGIETLSSEMTFELLVEHSDSDEKFIELDGIKTLNDDRQMELSGGIPEDSERQIDLTGKIDIFSETLLDITGESEEQSERELEILSEEELSSEKTFEIQVEEA